MKLGIIVPYRKRPGHLRKFRESIESYLKDQDYELIVVEQNDDLPFNRGKLLNIGFQQAIRKQCDYVVFHDIDNWKVTGVKQFVNELEKKQTQFFKVAEFKWIGYENTCGIGVYRREI